MIIDLVLDRYHGAPYNPRQFYFEVLQYENGILNGENCEISRAMDYGDNSDVRTALRRYIATQNYNPLICCFVNAADWLTCDNGRDWQTEIDILA